MNPSIQTLTESPPNKTSEPFQTLSDLHLEIGRQYSSFQIPVCAQNLILAGDTGRLSDYDDYLNFLQRHINQFQRIFLVLGNHEFYGMSYSEGLLKARDLEREPALDERLILLEKTRYDVPNSHVTILGCTLWLKIAPEASEIVTSKVKDFRHMLDRTVEEHNANHDADVSWLSQQVDSVFMENKRNDDNEQKKAQKRVILIATHYAPSLDGTSSPQHARSAWSSAFATDILSSRDWPGVEYWIFGHTHYSTEFLENSVRVLSNQRGYVLSQTSSREKEDPFDARRVISL